MRTRTLGRIPLRKDTRIAHDARILGGGESVVKILNEAECRSGIPQVDKENVIARICRENGIDQEQLRNGSRRRTIAKAREEIIKELIIKSGFSLTEVSRSIGITPSGVANVLKKIENHR